MVDRKHVGERVDTLYDYIVQYKSENDGIAPSIKEMSAYLNVSSTSLTDYYLKKLAGAGRIVIVKNRRRHISIPGGRWSMVGQGEG